MLIDYSMAFFDRCADIYFNMFTGPEWRFDWLTAENVRRYFKDMAAAPRFKGYIYLNGNEAIGACFGDISDYFSTAQYYIKEIFVEQTIQRQGVGSRFLAEIEADLKKSGVDNVILSTSRNIGAYGFYKKNGYVENNETAFFVKFLRFDE